MAEFREKAAYSRTFRAIFCFHQIPSSPAISRSRSLQILDSVVESSVGAGNYCAGAFLGIQQGMGQAPNKKTPNLMRGRGFSASSSCRHLPPAPSLGFSWDLRLRRLSFRSYGQRRVRDSANAAFLPVRLHRRIDISCIVRSHSIFPIFGVLATLRGGWVARTFRFAAVAISAGLAIVGSRNLGRAKGRVLAIATARPPNRTRGVLITLFPNVRGGGYFPRALLLGAV